MHEPRARADAALEALSWNRPGAQVEWAPLPQDIGRFTVDSFPTSASIVAAADPARIAWHAGFRWCLSVEAGAIVWFDLKHRLWWRGTGEGINTRTLAGLTAQSFAQTGQLQPREVSFEPTPVDFSRDPSRRVAEQIKQWWEFSCQRHLSGKATPEEKDRHKDRFTRFVAGVLLLRTIEDMSCVDWLPQGRLLDTIGKKASAESFGDLVTTAAGRLNSRVLNRIARDLHVDVKKAIVRGSYDMDIDFAALDVDPVGAFYEEILGVDYEHTNKIQRDLFGNNLWTSENRNARREQGVYYTPRIYADTLARRLVRPAVRAAEGVEELPVVVDIAAGSGELLCAALREILSEPMWSGAEVAWEVLNSKLHALDINPLASQLCALNLLRTAIRYTPELLRGERRLPSLDANLNTGDALRRTTIDALPRADIVLINPPFHSPNRWQRPDPLVAVPELAEVDAHPNRAIAFFAAAVRLARPGAGLGIVMPSNLFSGPLSAPWRRWLAERVSLDFVVANYGTPFRDVHSYAGLIVGQKRTSAKQWRPRTRIVRISGAIDPERDTGALLSEMGEDPAVVKLIVPPIDEKSPDWLGRKPRDRAVNHRKRPLCEVMGDRFHQGIVLAPEPWKTNLFLFERIHDGSLIHSLTGQNLGTLTSPRLRPFVNAKKVHKRVPLWCEPVVDNLWAFVPPGGGATWSSIDVLRKKDPAGWIIGDCICRTIAAYANQRRELKADAQAFLLHATERELRFGAPKGFQDVSLPLVYASKVSVTANSSGQGRAWYAWVSLEGGVVPVSGLQMRAPRADYAAALATWMSVDELVEPLLGQGAPLRDGTIQFNLDSVAQWPIPDLREDRFENHLDELYAAFLAYREEAQELPPEDALRLPCYREVQQIAVALWNEG
ncbi:MAG TPA: N-6 DNA methylase [Sorangium sp.]|nr:N-6 DNA methylase [Sorangium sp.]